MLRLSSAVLGGALMCLGWLAAACNSAADPPESTPQASTTTAVAPQAATTAVSASASAPASTTLTAPAPSTTLRDPTEELGESGHSSGSDTPAEPSDADEPDGADDADEPHEPFDADMAAIVREWMDSAGAPGVVLAVSRDGEAPQTFAWGVSDLAARTPMTVDHHVRIGSVTKAATAAVVLQLVAEGLVDLDAPVADYLGPQWAPGYEHTAAVTVRDLLGHTSGFFEFATDAGFYKYASSRLAQTAEPDEILEYASQRGAVAALGTQFHYNTTGYLAAGLIIEAVTGNTAGAEMRSRVFEPLGLAHTYLPPGDFAPEPISNGYVGGTLAYILAPMLGLTAENRIAHQDSIFVDIGTMPLQYARTAGWTGGGIEARIGDVALLIRGLFAGGVLDDGQIAVMTAGHPGPDSSYGLGISTGEFQEHTAYFHGGGVPGFRTVAAYVPALDLGVAITANLLGIEAGNDIDELLTRLAPMLAATAP